MMTIYSRGYCLIQYFDINMLRIGESKIILLIVILTGISINAKIIVTEIVEVVTEPKIGIATRFKNSDIVFSNKTR